jgi:hypothetical protein
MGIDGSVHATECGAVGFVDQSVIAIQSRI